MVDPDLIAYFDQRFREQTAAWREEIAAVREEMTQQFAVVRAEGAADREETAQRFQRVEDTGRQTLVLVEGQRSHIDLLAEGYGGLNERLERVQGEIALLPGQFKGWIEPFLRNLDGRVRILEGWGVLQPPG